MSIPTAAAKLPTPPPGSEDVIGSAKPANSGGWDGTFEGTITEDGLFAATLVELRAKSGPNPFKPGEIRDELVWGFELDDQKGKGYLPWKTSFSLHEKSKLPKTSAVCGHPLKDDEPIKKTDFLGAKVKVFVELQPSKKDPSKSFPRITKVIAR